MYDILYRSMVITLGWGGGMHGRFGGTNILQKVIKQGGMLTSGGGHMPPAHPSVPMAMHIVSKDRKKKNHLPVQTLLACTSYTL